ncbi:hypothetical protein QLS31_16145 [Flavobacterium sp. XS2P24]|uniref:hypothetical protein n=1 Tax=Flavobacterium sp. XS2P24 TaxID=3041249 RepID=UPI0024A7C5C6|nr:hypothetical protein [Flavobacterium sp. XS2P24]MDI6051357.1 hypothetical protein [Flavobacterium sp. XS2P24]
MTNARFHYKSNIESINFDKICNLDRNIVLRLVECEFVEKKRKHLNHRKYWCRQKLFRHCNGLSSLHTGF